MRARPLLVLAMLCVPAAALAGGTAAGARCEPGCPPCAVDARGVAKADARSAGPRCQIKAHDLWRAAVAASPASHTLSAVAAASFRMRPRPPATLPPPPPGLERWQSSRLYLVPPSVAIE